MAKPMESPTGAGYISTHMPRRMFRLEHEVLNSLGGRNMMMDDLQFDSILPPAKKSKWTMSTFERECLEAHNRYRAQHGVPPLDLSSNLSKYATEWAQKLADSNSLQHRSSPKYGENLYMASGFQLKGEDAVISWYAEISKYNFNSAQFTPGTGHFTQVVWKDSKHLGVGVAKRGNSTWVVANYDPPGNFQGRFRENVLPKQK